MREVRTYRGHYSKTWSELLQKGDGMDGAVHVTRAVRSIVFSGVGHVTAEETRQRFDVGPRDVLIETHYSCISAGTELAKLSGLQTIDFPAPIGNRAVGRVLEVGSELNGVRQGNLVYSHLHHMSHSLGSHLVCRLPDELDTPAAATLGLALVAMTGVQTAGAELGDTAVVVGAGLVGQFAAQLLERSGVCTILVDLKPGRLAVAHACGVTHTVDASADDSVAAVMELTGGEGADVVLECTGEPAVVESVPGHARRGGTVVLVGSPRGPYRGDLTVFLQRFHLWRDHGDLTLKGAHEWKVPLYSDGHGKHSMERNCRILARLALEGTLQLDPLVSRVYDPRTPSEAYRDLRQNGERILGAVFDWRLGRNAECGD